MLQVRAGVRDVAKAMEYLQTATSFGLLPQDASKRVQLVQVDITDPDSIAPAIGSASKVSTSTTVHSKWLQEAESWETSRPCSGTACQIMPRSKLMSTHIDMAGLDCEDLVYNKHHASLFRHFRRIED